MSAALALSKDEASSIALLTFKAASTGLERTSLLSSRWHCIPYSHLK